MTIPPVWLERKFLAELRLQAAVARVRGSGGAQADINAASKALADVIDADLLLQFCATLPAEPSGTTPDTH